MRGRLVRADVIIIATLLLHTYAFTRSMCVRVCASVFVLCLFTVTVAMEKRIERTHAHTASDAMQTR